MTVMKVFCSHTSLNSDVSSSLIEFNSCMLSQCVYTLYDHPVYAVQGDRLLVMNFFKNAVRFLIVTAFFQLQNQCRQLLLSVLSTLQCLQ
jgi:hypothetical protein